MDEPNETTDRQQAGRENGPGAAGAPDAPSEQIAVLGGGFMGLGIAETAAVSGFGVNVIEADPGQVAAAAGKLERSLDRAVSGGKLDAGARHRALAAIDVSSDVSEIEGAGLVIEAVPENLDLKVRVMEEIDAAVGPEAIIASNTSSIPIAELAAATERPEKVLGLHFFSPVPVMKLVEVVIALDTGRDTIAEAERFIERIGKQPIETKDRSGFVVNMLLVPYLMSGVRMFEEGFASREDIDEGMRLGCGHPMGPLTLCDFIGLDVLYSVCDSLYEEFKRDEYAPPPLMKRMVASGRLGRKSGHGFYEYANE